MNSANHHLTMQPSRGWYGLAAAVAILGVGMFVWSLVGGVRHVLEFGNSLQRVVVPGGGELTLDEAGPYKVFYEPVTRFQGRSYDTAQPMPDMTLTLQRTSDGKPVTLDPTTSHEVYHINNTKGVSKWRFEIDQPGTYRLDADHPSGSGPNLVLAVGQLNVWSLMTSVFGIFGGAAAAIFAFIAALVICLVVFTKRRESYPELPVHPGGPR